jgi:uncharacterized Ntn-hydrolase superfamily protein
MTFSIVGRSADGGAFGVAVASRFLAVGSAVPAAEAGVGALATQSYANLAYRPQGLTLLRTGVSAADAVAGLTAADPQRGHRQLGVVGRTGEGATFTGADCHPWAGGVAGDGYAIQGNILTGPEVVDAMRDAWLRAVTGTEPGRSLARDLLAVLAAGDRTGGDRRGRQSAALLVVRPGGGYGGTADVEVDLRVDDHADPVAELDRLLGLHELYFTRPDPGDAARPHRRAGRRGPGTVARAGLSEYARLARGRAGRLGRHGEPRGTARAGAHRSAGATGPARLMPASSTIW